MASYHACHNRFFQKSGKAKFLLLLIIILSASKIFCQQKQICIVTENWEPYIGPTLPGKGVLAELTFTIFERKGYKATIEFFPWARALNMIKQGDADCLLGAFYSDERAAYILYPDSILTQETLVYSLKETNLIFHNLHDLAHCRIGVVRSAINGRAFDEATYLNKVEAVNIDQCIKMLTNERITAFTGPKNTVAYVIRNHYPEYIGQIIPIGNPLSQEKIYCGISKKTPNSLEVAKAFNEGLKEIQKDGTFNKILKKYNFISLGF